MLQRKRFGFGPELLEVPYKGYVTQGSAGPCGPGSHGWLTTATILLHKPDQTVLQVDEFQHSLLRYDDGDVAAWFGLGIAEIMVDAYLPPAAYYLIPMDVARAVYFLRRGAEDHHKREIRRPSLYEALDFLEKFLNEKKWLVRRYRNALRGDTRNQREKMEQREQLRVRFRGIQQACAETILAEMNELAVDFRANKPAIEKLRRQLSVVREPVAL